MSAAVLIPVGDGPAVVACTTCQRPGDPTAGARLIAVLHALQASDPAYAGIAVQAMPCLFACGDGCAVHLRAPGRIGYVLGRFAPDTDAARAILDYAVLHAASDIGEVAYDAWPERIKGRFLTRTPPPGFVVT